MTERQQWRRPWAQRFAGYLARHHLDLAEYLTGALIQHAINQRSKRHQVASDDLHEMRHLWAALTAGNSDECTPDECRLIGVTMLSSVHGLYCSIVTARGQEYETFGDQIAPRAAPDDWRGLLTEWTLVLRELDGHVAVGAGVSGDEEG